VSICGLKVTLRIGFDSVFHLGDRAVLDEASAIRGVDSVEVESAMVSLGWSWSLVKRMTRWWK